MSGPEIWVEGYLSWDDNNADVLELGSPEGSLLDQLAVLGTQYRGQLVRLRVTVEVLSADPVTGDPHDRTRPDWPTLCTVCEKPLKHRDWVFIGGHPVCDRSLRHVQIYSGEVPKQ